MTSPTGRRMRWPQGYATGPVKMNKLVADNEKARQKFIECDLSALEARVIAMLSEGHIPEGVKESEES